MSLLAMGAIICDATIAPKQNTHIRMYSSAFATYDSTR